MKLDLMHAWPPWRQRKTRQVDCTWRATAGHSRMSVDRYARAADG
jgi:hypothetical protein